MRKLIFLFSFLWLYQNSFSQTDSSSVINEEINFDDFGNADENVVKTYCTQKVNYLSPTRFISLGYESVSNFHLSSTADQGTKESHVDKFGGIRLGISAPVISRSNLIVSMGLSYWNTSVDIKNPERSELFGSINALNSTGVNTTIFKPLNNKNFLIIQANGDISGNYQKLDQLNTKGLTYSAVVIYGWKKDDNLMWGLGVSRTYRAGQLIHVPAILYNKTFNKKLGVEAILPAKANLRRNFSPNSFLMLGYEIEGNTYYLGKVNNTETYLRRGELKPRISFEKKLIGFFWISAQAGWRYNYRFDAFKNQNSVKNEMPLFTNTLGNPFYFNVSLNFVSP